MKPRLSRRKQLTLLGVVIFGSLGDVSLSHGMKHVAQDLGGGISIHHLGDLFTAIFTPWVAIGIVLLIAFFASYLSSLSFADLTYVLPATAIGYINTALLARFVLHEHVDVKRWIGISLIALGVGYVTRGPVNTVNYEGGEAEQVGAPPAGGAD